jgi:hypothetical protein
MGFGKPQNAVPMFGMPDYIKNMNQQPSAIQAPQGRGMFGRFANMLGKGGAGEYGKSGASQALFLLGAGLGGASAGNPAATAQMMSGRSNDLALERETAQAAEQQRREAMQAQISQQQADQQFMQNAQTGGFSPEQIARMQMARNANPEEFGKSFSGNFGFNTVSEGSEYSQFGGDMMKNEKTFTPVAPEKLAIDQQNADASTLTAQARNRDSLTNEWEARNAPVDEGPDVSGESALRKEFLSQNKGFQEIQRAYGRILETDPTNAAGQMSLIFQYMKMMDPGSTVREGEFANAQNTTGIPGQVLNAYNRARKGEFLNTTQVGEFQRQAQKLYGAAADDFELSFNQYRDTAQQYSFDGGRAVPDLRNPGFGNSQVVTISSDAEFDSLPSGAEYIGPDGVRRRKS